MDLVAFELIGTLACAVAFVCILKVTLFYVACTGVVPTAVQRRLVLLLGGR